jgi:hypothetical protein
MPFRLYTDEGALIRGEFDSVGDLRRGFDILTREGFWLSTDVMPSPYHAVECTEETAVKYARERLGVENVDLSADPETRPESPSS